MKLASLSTLFLSASLLAAAPVPGARASQPATERWILASQNKDGGFGLYPGDGSNLLGTFCAVHSLMLLNADIPSREKIASFILTKQRPQGGFCNRFGNRPDQPVLQMTFYAVKTLAALNALPEDTRAVADWINGQRVPGGGFLWDYYIAPDVADKSSTRSAYYAVQALAAMGQSPKNRDSLVAFLNVRQTNSQRKDGSFEEQDLAPNTEVPQAVGMVFYTGMGLAALKTLGKACPMPGKAAAYLRGAQRKDGGIGKGLGRYHCYDDRDISRIQEAYYASLGLSALGERFADEKGLERWVRGCLRPDGGFGRRAGDCPPDMEATYQALVTLFFLKAAFPAPEKVASPAREPDAPAPPFICEQVDAGDPDQVRYLYRIGKPIYDRNIPQGELAAARALVSWVNDNMLFCSNWNHSGAQALIDGLGACGTQARSY
ncbi:MAG: prenyltransferase/squalene oxidase repeat-containing protein, partial [Syntrophaceae bacterium]